MNCEICGAFEENLASVKIEDAFMNVCTDCSKYGKYVVRTESSPSNRRYGGLYEKELKQDFVDILRKGLDSKGLSAEELAYNIKCSPNDIRKILKGSMLPDLNTARKLERFFKVVLYDVETKNDTKLISKDTDLSFENVVEIKKKK